MCKHHNPNLSIYKLNNLGFEFQETDKRRRENITEKKKTSTTQNKKTSKISSNKHHDKIIITFIVIQT